MAKQPKKTTRARSKPPAGKKPSRSRSKSTVRGRTKSPVRRRRPTSRKLRAVLSPYWTCSTPASARSKGFKVIRWIETHCVFTQGKWIGKPFRLLPWQKLFILALFAVGEDGRRLHRWALLGVPKKNGKTELAAALALYFLIGDEEPAPLVICAAASDDQADLVFGAARTMCEMSPTLSQITDPYEKEILVPSIPGAKLKRVAAVAGTNDGQNIHAVICDELHEWMGAKGESVWNVLTNGSGAREQPMVLQITTAGFDQETICYRQFDYGRKVAQGLITDKRYLFWWIEAPPDSDWRDPKTWAATNPSWGVTPHPDYLEDQISKKPENIFRRYFLNQWTSSAERWIPLEKWDACAGDPDIGVGDAVWVGIDGAAKRDSTAVVMVKPTGSTLHIRAHVFEPPGEGEVIDPAVVEEFVKQLHRDFDVEEFLFDPQLFFRSAQLLIEEGLPMVEFPQSHQRMCPASQALFDAVMEGRVRHGGDRTLRAHADAAVAKETGRGWRLDKVKATARIDAMVAMAMAVYRTQEGEDPGLDVLVV